MQDDDGDTPRRMFEVLGAKPEKEPIPLERRQEYLRRAVARGLADAEAGRFSTHSVQDIARETACEKD